MSEKETETCFLCGRSVRIISVIGEEIPICLCCDEVFDPLVKRFELDGLDVVRALKEMIVKKLGDTIDG